MVTVEGRRLMKKRKVTMRSVPGQHVTVEPDQSTSSVAKFCSLGLKFTARTCRSRVLIESGFIQVLAN